MLLLVIALPLILGTLLTALLGMRFAPSGVAASAAGRLSVAFVAGFITSLCLILLLRHADAVWQGQVISQNISWVAQLGLNIDLRLDALALMFALLITAMGLLIVIYAYYYLGIEDSVGKFYSLLMLFMAAMLGIVLSDNLFILLVFWELTSISSFLLVGYWGHRADARQGARMALTVTGGGGLVMLAGFILLSHIGGNSQISALIAQKELIQSHPLFFAALVLILLGCFTKSAQFPFHFWLPQAMAAPTPVSAYLHSATMVKAGVFLLLRLTPVIGGNTWFLYLVAGTGFFTLLYAAINAIFKHDIKGLLAFSTISQLGLMVFLIGIGSPLAIMAAVFHIMNHACFKAALFMSAGIVDHATGTRDLRRLGGLYKLLPWTAAAAIIAAFSMAGVPPLNGFISKEMYLTEVVDLARMGAQTSQVWSDFAWLLPVLATLAAIFSATYSFRYVHDLFFNGKPKDLPHEHLHKPSWGMRLPMLFLAALCVLVGCMPVLLAGTVVASVSQVVLGQPLPEGLYLSLWHGWNLPLFLSLLALLGGAFFYAYLSKNGRLHRLEIENYFKKMTGQNLFRRFFDTLWYFGGRVTDKLENNSLQSYLLWILLVVLALVLWGFAQYGWPGVGARNVLASNASAWVFFGILCVLCAALVRQHHNRLLSIVLVGGIGLLTCLVFLVFSAPDLALTQLAVEVVSTVLLLMGLALLPAKSPKESPPTRKIFHASIALSVGVGMSIVTYLLITRDFSSISWYFLQQSLPGGGGTNVVNVILVDFRGYDTMGEITVLGIAALGVLALMEGLRIQSPSPNGGAHPWGFAAHPLMLSVVSRLVLPLALLVSLYIFWRGHNMPGGGFIAGLITSVAIVLQYMALGQQQAENLLGARYGRRYVQSIGIGLGIAAVTGVGAMFLGQPFLTSAHGHPSVPLFGELALASAALFDLGVYFTVVGATMLTVSVLGAVSKEVQP